MKIHRLLIGTYTPEKIYEKILEDPFDFFYMKSGGSIADDYEYVTKIRYAIEELNRWKKDTTYHITSIQCAEYCGRWYIKII